jgi:ABC-type transport system involved in cytochrome c biogenesis permease subunit
MRLLWTIVKVALALALVIPISIIVLVTALGILGTLLGLAILTLKVAVFGLIAWGAFRLLGALLRGPSPRSQPMEIKPLTTVDPYQEAAMRELDRELGEVR